VFCKSGIKLTSGAINAHPPVAPVLLIVLPAKNPLDGLTTCPILFMESTLLVKKLSV
jgi:hypothetical protein